MRKSVDGPLARAILVMVLSVTGVGFGQVIENPAEPKAKNAGRVVVPEEVLTISDEGTSDYYFKWPRGLRTAPDGSLLLIDENQALRFDKDGKFIHDIFDADGRFIGRVPLKPFGIEILKGKYYALEEDEDGYQAVKRYAVTWTVK